MIKLEDAKWNIEERLMLMDGKVLNEDFFGFTEYQGPDKWEKTPEEGQIGCPYNLFVCNRCKEFMFWSRIYGEFPVLNPFTEIDPYREARMISENHQRYFCHVYYIHYTV